MASSDQGAFPPANLRALAGEVASLLASRNETVSVAETAAGGLISASILATPGASKIYRGGLTVRVTISTSRVRRRFVASTTVSPWELRMGSR